MELFWSFLKEVFDTWIEKVGIILTILPFIEKIPRVKKWLNDKPLVERFIPALWVIGALCIVWGFYAAWRNQYDAATTMRSKFEELTIPNLQGEITFLGMGMSPKKHDDSIVLIQAAIRNLGAPSIVDHFVASIRTESGTIVGHQIPASDKGIFAKMPASGDQLVLKDSEYLPGKGMSQPVQHGGGLEGFFLAYFIGIKVTDFTTKRTVVVLSYRDVTGKPYSIELLATGKSDLAFPSTFLKQK